jgi:putative peptidoglycan lipid II flippase
MLLLGRVSGLFRELELARAFGISRQADIAVVLLTLPDLLVNLLLSGGLSSALVPRFKQLPVDAREALFRQVSLLSALAFALAGVVLFLYPKAVFGLMAPGVAGLSALAGSGVVAGVALALPLTALSGVTAAYLNAHGRYLIAGAGTLLFNLCVIAVLVLHARGANTLVSLAFAIGAGATLRLVTQVAVLPRSTWHSLSLGPLADRIMLQAFAAGVFASAMALIPQVVVRAAASLLGSGAVASFNYAQKLVELPVGILITTISTVALTKLSGLIAEKREDAVRLELFKDLRMACLLGVLVVVLGLAFAEPVVSLLFGRGQMDPAALARVTALTRVALLGIPFVAISSLMIAVLNARLLTSTVFRVTLYGVLVLPLLTAPGLWLRSDGLLMGAVVVFQALVALGLARKADVQLVGTGGVFAGKAVAALAMGVAVAIPFVTAGYVLEGGPDLLQLGIGGVGFLLALFCSLRVIR